MKTGEWTPERLRTEHRGPNTYRSLLPARAAASPRPSPLCFFCMGYLLQRAKLSVGAQSQSLIRPLWGLGPGRRCRRIGWRASDNQPRAGCRAASGTRPPWRADVQLGRRAREGNQLERGRRVSEVELEGVRFPSEGPGGAEALVAHDEPVQIAAEDRGRSVTLTVTAAGGESSARQFVALQPPPAVTAAFSAAVNGLTVLFTNQSTGNPTSFAWNFGDCFAPAGGSGCTSSQPSPSHTYGAPGTYTVSLGVANASGASDTASQFVSVGVSGKPPQAAFDFQGSGLAVTFADRSTGGPTSWTWTFGDGAASTQQNPTHVYGAAGTYNVTLVAANAAGQSSASKFVTVPAGTAPQANFTFQAGGLTVAFADTSTGGPTSWSWSFGDGGAGAAEDGWFRPLLRAGGRVCRGGERSASARGPDGEGIFPLSRGGAVLARRAPPGHPLWPLFESSRRGAGRLGVPPQGRARSPGRAALRRAPGGRPGRAVPFGGSSSIRRRSAGDRPGAGSNPARGWWRGSLPSPRKARSRRRSVRPAGGGP
jgi:PKD repeat protein